MEEASNSLSTGYAANPSKVPAYLPKVQAYLPKVPVKGTFLDSVFNTIIKTQVKNVHFANTFNGCAGTFDGCVVQPVESVLLASFEWNLKTLYIWHPKKLL